MATLYTVLSGTLVNSGIALSGQGTQVFANGSFVGAGIYVFGFRLIDLRVQFQSIFWYISHIHVGVFLLLLIRSMQRVKKLDKFETMIWIDFNFSEVKACKAVNNIHSSIHPYIHTYIHTSIYLHIPKETSDVERVEGSSHTKLNSQLINNKYWVENSRKIVITTKST